MRSGELRPELSRHTDMDWRDGQHHYRYSGIIIIIIIIKSAAGQFLGINLNMKSHYLNKVLTLNKHSDNHL